MANTLIKLPVRHLVEFVLREGSLATGYVGGSLNRAVEGTRGHQYVQKARPDGYQAEVPVTHTFWRDGLQFEISGRIDGIFPNVDMLTLDEIKTTNHDLNTLTEEYNPLHWAQVKVYAYILATQQKLDEIAVQLTYFHLESRQTKEFQRVFTCDQLNAFFEELITIYANWAVQTQNWLALRNQSINDLEFPYPDYRLGQREMAVAVYTAIKRRDKLFGQAPTGIGKSIATLFPSVKAIGTGLINKIFYLTAKTPGRTVAEKALDDMRDAGLHLKSVTLTAKDKV